MPSDDTTRLYLELHRVEDRVNAAIAELKVDHSQLDDIATRRHEENVKRLMRIETHINQTLGAYNALRYVIHVLSAVGGAVAAFFWDRLTSSGK